MRSVAEITQQVLAENRELDPAQVRAFLGRAEPDYLQRFDPATIAKHIRALRELSADTPAAVLCERQRDGLVGCTVLGFDHPFEFSSITGMMAGTGFSI